MEETMQTKRKPNISKTAFWDVNFEKIDFENSSVFVMDKVFNYGVFSDQLEIIRFYGIERIKKNIVKIAYFREPVLAFLSTFFNLDKALFIAYQRRQNQPKYWNTNTVNAENYVDEQSNGSNKKINKK